MCFFRNLPVCDIPSIHVVGGIRSVMPRPGPLLRAGLLALVVLVLVGLAGRVLSAQPRAASLAPELQGAPLDSAARAKALRVARDIMRATRYCALVTMDATAGSVARTIDPAPPDSLMIVRFVTNPQSRKVRQLAADPRVVLYYFDATAQRYATLYGRARVVAAADRARRWHEAWTPFYPDRARNVTMYEVVPERLEVVSPGEGLTGDSVSWAPPAVLFPRLRRPR